ncbi:MAG: RHS repeat-associated core domain-containing protein [Prevotella sp.]|nr:RHS repeat-associated core domain-containing protein [Prevotella sp.]
MEYNALGKPASIHDWGLGRTLTLAYSPEGERWSGEERDGSGNLVAEYRYLGDMEAVRHTDVYFPTYYYHLGHGVLAVDVHGDVSVYYMLTDPLGSVTDIYTADGTPVFKATYDPWGQQTVALNTIGYRRGYCGHEMLQVYGLINMNARLYDPVTARFLAPDNYVQDPTNSQNFNRYSYCLNNPLKYTDL